MAKKPNRYSPSAPATPAGDATAGAPDANAMWSVGKLGEMWGAAASAHYARAGMEEKSKAFLAQGAEIYTDEHGQPRAAAD